MGARRSPHGRVVDGLLTFAAFCSLVVLVAGFLTGVGPLMTLGVVIGGVGLVSGFVALGKELPVHAALTLGLVILALDVGTVALMWATT
ncbi:hypothetical protein [Nocardioides sp.]|uniref:hypothetical protein n=1 Tax=Nocardioides sp. TaxID=35761 RepID=UPI002CC3DE7F|nr:hypothetical protein [Nocardioides sp.]HXH79795.1 hypothetical protein [Nocardioides sp.]